MLFVPTKFSKIFRTIHLFQANISMLQVIENRWLAIVGCCCCRRIMGVVIVVNQFWVFLFA